MQTLGHGENLEKLIFLCFFLQKMKFQTNGKSALLTVWYLAAQKILCATRRLIYVKPQCHASLTAPLECYAQMILVIILNVTTMRSACF
jgi:hypothetical protein